MNTTKIESRTSAFFDRAVRTIEEIFPSYLDEKKTFVLPFEQSPKYLQSRLSYPPWSINDEVRARIRADNFSEQGVRESMLRTEERTFRSVGQIALVDIKYSGCNDPIAALKSRDQCVARIVSVDALIQGTGEEACLKNPDAIGLARDGSPYVVLHYLVKTEQPRVYDHLRLGFSQSFPD